VVLSIASKNSVSTILEIEEYEKIRQICKVFPMRNVETRYVISCIFFIEDSFQLILVMILKGYMNELKRRLLESQSAGALIIY